MRVLDRAAGCCWVMQWMLPPPTTMFLEGTATTWRCGNSSWMIFLTLHKALYPRTVLMMGRAGALLLGGCVLGAMAAQEGSTKEGSTCMAICSPWPMLGEVELLHGGSAHLSSASCSPKAGMTTPELQM